MKSLVSFSLLLFTKTVSRTLFTLKTNWPMDKKQIPWNDVKLIILLNHTSLLEPLYVGALPNSFLRTLSKKMVAPGADKTLNRPIVGLFYKLFSPGMVSITRKRDETWEQFTRTIANDSITVIIPEGRMKRPNGLDLNGNKMTVKGGVADVLSVLKGGQMIVAYSGGLHHIHAPGEKAYRFFKTIKLNLDVLPIDSFNNQFALPIGSEEWKKAVIADLQHRLETKVPALDE
jgi:hypothetical protein